MDLLPVVDEVVVLVGGQLLGLSIGGEAQRAARPDKQLAQHRPQDGPSAADRQDQPTRAGGAGGDLYHCY